MKNFTGKPTVYNMDSFPQELQALLKLAELDAQIYWNVPLKKSFQTPIEALNAPKPCWKLWIGPQGQAHNYPDWTDSGQWSLPVFSPKGFKWGEVHPLVRSHLQAYLANPTKASTGPAAGSATLTAAGTVTPAQFAAAEVHVFNGTFTYTIE